MKIIKHNNIIITCIRDQNGLYDLSLKNKTITPPATSTTSTPPSTPTNVANGITKVDQTAGELAQYLSASCFNPSPSALVWTIRRNHLVSWPGITKRLINKHLPKNIATAKGRLDQEIKNLQST